MADQKFGGIIWTNHVLQRLKERNINQGDAWATWKNPDNSRFAESKSAWVYYKNFGNKKIEVVAKKNEKGKWIVLSVWAKPVFKQKSPKKMKSLWKTLLNQLLGIK